MPRHSAYNPDYESLYSGIEITPDVLHVLRTSDRKMRYMEHQLKTERFVEDQEQRVAKFLPSRETSLDEMIEKEHRQFAAEQPSWEDEFATSGIDLSLTFGNKTAGTVGKRADSGNLL